MCTRLLSLSSHPNWIFFKCRRPHPAEDYSFEVPYAHYRSSDGSVDPFAHPRKQPKYATFELDDGTYSLVSHWGRLKLGLRGRFWFFFVFPCSLLLSA